MHRRVCARTRNAMQRSQAPQLLRLRLTRSEHLVGQEDHHVKLRLALVRQHHLAAPLVALCLRGARVAHKHVSLRRVLMGRYAQRGSAALHPFSDRASLDKFAGLLHARSVGAYEVRVRTIALTRAFGCWLARMCSSSSKPGDLLV